VPIISTWLISDAHAKTLTARLVVWGSQFVTTDTLKPFFFQAQTATVEAMSVVAHTARSALSESVEEHHERVL
jgi:hypothetical protein